MVEESYFMFNNKSSTDFAIVIDEEWMPPEQLAEVECDYIEIPGRDGYLTINKERKKSLEKTISGVLIDDDRRIEVMRWLQSDGVLILSTEPNVFYKAKVYGAVKFFYHFTSRQFEVTFICQPYAYLHSGKDMVTVTTKDKVLYNPTEEISKPIIKIYGSGSVDMIINNNIHKFNINEYVTIDSELMESYKDTSMVTFTGDFPELTPGENNISWDGDVTKIEIVPRWRR